MQSHMFIPWVYEWMSGRAMIFMLTLDMHVRVCSATGFCSTSTATRLSATNVPLTLPFFYSKAYFLDFSTSITSLQTNPAIFRLLGSCSPGYIIIHSSTWFDTTIRCVNDNTTQQYESVPKHLAISQHILVDSAAATFSPPRDKILAQLA